MKITEVQILKEAADDLDDGREFYNQVYEGVGSYFWESIISDIESLIIFAGIHQKTYGYYRMLSKRFPYAIYYEIVNQTARIEAILPMRRNPAWIKKNLKSR